MEFVRAADEQWTVIRRAPLAVDFWSRSQKQDRKSKTKIRTVTHFETVSVNLAREPRKSYVKQQRCKRKWLILNAPLFGIAHALAEDRRSGAQMGRSRERLRPEVFLSAPFAFLRIP
jgi:hypothetical protein